MWAVTIQVNSQPENTQASLPSWHTSIPFRLGPCGPAYSTQASTETPQWKHNEQTSEKKRDRFRRGGFLRGAQSHHILQSGAHCPKRGLFLSLAPPSFPLFFCGQPPPPLALYFLNTSEWWCSLFLLSLPPSFKLLYFLLPYFHGFHPSN